MKNRILEQAQQQDRPRIGHLQLALTIDGAQHEKK
jgi:hypothetical protein